MILRACSILFLTLFSLPLVAETAIDAFRAAEAKFREHEFAAAAEQFEAFLASYPEDSRRVPAAYRIGEALFQLEKYEEAAAAYERALDQYPEAPETPIAWHNLGRIRLQLEQAEAAEKAFRQAVVGGDEGIRQEASLGIGEALMRRDRFVEAAAHYRELLAAHPEHAQRIDILFTIGYALSAANQHEQAIEPLRELLAADPAPDVKKRAQILLGDAYMQSGRAADAVTLLRGMREEHPKDDDVLIRLAWAQLEADQQAAASATFLEYAEEFPRGQFVGNALYNAGIVLYNLGHADQAVSAFIQLRKLAPESEEAKEMRLWLGTAAFQAGQHELAEKELSSLLAGDDIPANTLEVASFTRAQSMSAREAFTEAVAAYQQFVAAYPESSHLPNALFAQAVAQHAIGQTTEAMDTLRRLLAGDPPPELRRHAQVALAEYLYLRGQWQAAREHLAQLVESSTPTELPHLLYRLGWTEFELKNHEESRARFQQLAELESRYSAEARYMAGVTAERLGDAEAAMEHYENLIAGGETTELVEKAFLRLAFLYTGDKAAENLAAYRERFPQGSRYGLMRLQAIERLLDSGQLAEAEAGYREVLQEKLDPLTAAAAWYGLGWSLRRQGKGDAAASAFAQVAKHKPDREMGFDAILQQAEILYEQDRFEAAAALFKQLEQADGTLGERVLYMLGWSAVQQNDAKAAEAAFRQVIRRFPDGAYYADSALRLASILSDNGHFEEARQILESALGKAQPDLREPLLHLYSDLLVATRDWQKLIEVADQMRKEFPNSTQHYLLAFRQGLAYKAIGETDKAVTAFRETIANTEGPEAAKAQFNLGTIFAARGAWADAAAAFASVESNYDYSEITSKALYHAIDAYLNAEGNESPRIASLMKTLRDAYPDSPWMTHAEKRIAEATDPSP